MQYRELFESVSAASRELAKKAAEDIYDLLIGFSAEIIKQTPFIIAENVKDLNLMNSSDPRYDRLMLTPERLRDMADDIISVAKLPSPLGKITEERFMPNGLNISRISVPLGVVGIIYEARPNVTIDVFSLCIKSGNACILKGGSDAKHSNEAIVKVIKKVLKDFSFNVSLCELLPSDRKSTLEMLSARGYIDVVIPRGSKQLIDYVAENSKIPVIETGAGIVHIYLDESADPVKASSVINNAKTRRVSVCNALDCLIVHSQQLSGLADILSPLAKSNVIIYSDAASHAVLKNNYPESLLLNANEESYGNEFLSYTMSVKTVDNIDGALAHIQKYGSKHSEAILSNNNENIRRFLDEVDASAVYVNASTAFTDGGQFGMGAEIGISTQKLHARGPMGLAELTSYKWIISGDGQIRN